MGGGGNAWRGTRELSEGMKMFCILFWMVIPTWMLFLFSIAV